MHQLLVDYKSKLQQIIFYKRTYTRTQLIAVSYRLQDQDGKNTTL